MKKILITLLMTFFTPIFLHAAGIGIYVPYAVDVKKEGTYTYDYSTQGSDYDYSYNLESDSGLGIAIATNLGKESVFGYKIALELTSPEIENATKSQIKLAMLHTFEFGVIRTRNIRVWIGARINFAYVSMEASDEDNNDGSDGDDDDFSFHDLFDNVSRYIENEDSSETYDRSGFEYGLAPVIGINYNMGRFFAVCLDIDYKFAKQNGSDDYGSFSEDVRGVTARLGVFFKFGERFNYQTYDDSSTPKQEELNSYEKETSSPSDEWKSSDGWD